MTETDLRPFTENPKCPKCGYAVVRKHYTVTQTVHGEPGERLVVTCQECGYQWCMSCKGPEQR